MNLTLKKNTNMHHITLNIPELSHVNYEHISDTGAESVFMNAPCSCEHTPLNQM